MNRSDFLAQLRRALHGLPEAEIEDILSDYTQHFAEGTAAGRSEEEVAAALGDPGRLARELRAEAKLRRWETYRTPGALIGAIVALGGLLAIDLLILLPFLCCLVFAVFIAGIVLLALGVGGIVVLFSSLFQSYSVAAESPARRALPDPAILKFKRFTAPFALTDPLPRMAMSNASCLSPSSVILPEPFMPTLFREGPRRSTAMAPDLQEQQPFFLTRICPSSMRTRLSTDAAPRIVSCHLTSGW